jgi:hypothetical protein
VRVGLDPADLEAELDVLARAQERHEAALLRDERDLAPAQLGAAGAVERLHLGARTRTSPASGGRGPRAGAAGSSCPSRTGR